jgi:hypothetical protein
MSQAFPRLASVLVLACLVLLPVAARAADPTYTVSGIHVDATAPSASAAEAIAIDQGRPKAWNILFRRIAKQSDWDKQPRLDADGLRRIARGYTVANERRSTTRFVADVTYIFSREAVARVMTGISSTYRLVTARRIVLIPMAPTFSSSSNWTSTFASARFVGSVVPFAVPTGSAPDIAALGRLEFDATTWADVQQVAARIHASEAVLVLAIPLGNRMQVWLKRIGAAETPMKTSVDVPMQKNDTQTYPLAADAAVHALEVMYAQKPAVDFGPKTSLTADVHIDSLQQWATLQNAMTSISNVNGIQVQAMDIGLVRITLLYQGSTDQLRESLAPVGVALTKAADDSWSIAWQAPVKPTTASANP